MHLFRVSEGKSLKLDILSMYHTGSVRSQRIIHATKELVILYLSIELYNVHTLNRIVYEVWTYKYEEGFEREKCDVVIQ